MRKVRMFARWAKNARVFTKPGKELSIAVRLGGDKNRWCHPLPSKKYQVNLFLAKTIGSKLQ